MLKRKALLLGLMAVLLASLAFGSETIANWAAPATWSPPSSFGLHTLSESPPVPFIPITPCRVADTRGNGFGGQYGPPALVANANRSFTITGVCGIPASADAVSFNFAALNVGGAGDLRVFPAGAGLPLVSTLNYNANTPNIANAAVVPLGTGGAITVRADAVAVDLIIDVNGYYSGTPGSADNYFSIDNNSNSFTAHFYNHSTSCGGPCGVASYTNSGHALFGEAQATTGVVFGVEGLSESTSNDTAGVRGQADSTTGRVFGVSGSVVSSHAQAAAIYGTASQALANAGHFHNGGAGGIGSIDTFVSTSTGGVDYGVFTNGRLRGGSLDIAGAPKNFISPHPVDPSKEIRYASVEAPTVDVYFRGTGTLSNGYAYIEVPDHFRYTAREGTYMTTLTSVGRSVALSVESEGPEGIVVRGSGNARFHFVIYAERAEIEGYEPVQPNVSFTPEALEKGQVLKSLPSTTKALLVRNGTLNEDGTYNEATARAMGWVIPEPASRIQPWK